MGPLSYLDGRGGETLRILDQQIELYVRQQTRVVVDVLDAHSRRFFHSTLQRDGTTVVSLQPSREHAHQQQLVLLRNAPEPFCPHLRR